MSSHITTNRMAHRRFSLRAFFVARQMTVEIRHGITYKRIALRLRVAGALGSGG
jgi:hypothetical protein